MRIWTIHPRYLDTKGLLAAWREGLLAQKVLQNKTKGYRNHPQLLRFRAAADSTAAIASYLVGVYEEAVERGYNFDADKINHPRSSGPIPCTRGQLLHEWMHLKLKLETRDAKLHAELVDVAEPQPHPLFQIVAGDVEEWERGRGFGR